MAFSPGFRWGTSLLPGDAITYERLFDQTAITYPYVTRNELSGETIKTILEDVCDNLFNPDPYYQQGGDMVRVGGLRYTCEPGATMGNRISGMSLNGKPLDASKSYTVAGWAPVAEQARDSGAEPIWDVMARYLRSRKTIRPSTLNVPRLIGVEGNPGLA
jgi:sulfur-oxidizing protein SoxB